MFYFFKKNRCITMINTKGIRTWFGLVIYAQYNLATDKTDIFISKSNETVYMENNIFLPQVLLACITSFDWCYTYLFEVETRGSNAPHQ
ncbi:unnamed protein product [Cunninghamella echinulata]